MLSTEGAAAQNSTGREISRGMVALFKEHAGRGPTSARTMINHRLAVVILEDTLTKAERVLAADGQVDLVREMRRALIATMEAEIADLIGEWLGRDVQAVCGDHAVEPDRAMVAVVLDPNGQPDAPDAAGANDRSVDPSAMVDPRDRERQREISRAMVALLKDFVGRGPTDARTYIGRDVVVVLLADTLTKAERTLAERTRPENVRELRREFQEAMHGEIVGIVEWHTGRNVDAFLSDHSIFPDYAIEVLVLEPEPAAV